MKVTNKYLIDREVVLTATNIRDLLREEFHLLPKNAKVQVYPVLSGVRTEPEVLVTWQEEFDGFSDPHPDEDITDLKAE